MRDARKPRRTWKELEATEKLGYAWVVIYFILILATALTIIVPAYKKWQLEHPDEKQGTLAPARGAALAALPSEEAHHGSHHSPYLAGEALGVPNSARLG